MSTMSSSGSPDDLTCRSCIFLKRSRWQQSCHHPEGGSWNPVAGWVPDSDPYANRQPDGFCGPEGQYWKAKPEAEPSKSWLHSLIRWLVR